MTVSLKHDHAVLVGLSTDTKPAAGYPAGTEFREANTGISYWWSGTAWTPLRQVVEEGRYAYETVAASQTAQVLGGAGATGDFLHAIIIVPAALAAGAVTLLDGSTSISLYSGASALTEVRPMVLEFNVVSVSGPWKVTTGASVSVIGIGRFSA